MVMFDAEEVLGIYCMGESMRLAVGIDPGIGKLLGLTFAWRGSMQPAKVEWLAAVVFFCDDPQEVYFACDAVHFNLMNFVIEDRQTGDADDDQLSDTGLIEQAEEAMTTLRQIATSHDRRVTTASTLRVNSTVVGGRPTLDHFYTLDGQVSWLLLEAMKYDPQVQVEYTGADHPTIPKKSEDCFTAGRNEPCPCGSGKKFKKCHGFLQ